jgi:hypothetical protein
MSDWLSAIDFRSSVLLDQLPEPRDTAYCSRATTRRVTGLIGGDEAVDRPRRATDEEPVDVGERGERPGIGWVDAAAIENRYLATRLAEKLFAPGPDHLGNRFDVLGAGRGAAGADRPDRLVGDLEQLQMPRLDASDSS